MSIQSNKQQRFITWGFDLEVASEDGQVHGSVPTASDLNLESAKFIFFPKSLYSSQSQLFGNLGKAPLCAKTLQLIIIFKVLVFTEQIRQ